MERKVIHLWIPDMFAFKGGIQVYSAFVLKTLQHGFETIQYDVFLKHDRECTSRQYLTPNTRFHFAGQCISRLRTFYFAVQLFIYGLWRCPDLIFSTHLNFTILAYWLKRFAGIPYWTVAHGIDAWDIQKPALKKALHHADRILAVSNYTRDRLLKEQNLDPAKVLLLPNTFDISRFRVTDKPIYLLKRYELSCKQPIILTVARLASFEAYKGYDSIIQALPKIKCQIPDVHYILAGKGDDQPRIEQLINQLGLRDCVTLTGFVPEEELCDYYNLCDVFAMPSKGEGFGIVYLEALACGKPCLAGNQDGATEALCQGELGVLVNPDDVGAIAHALIQLLQGTYPNSLFYQPEALRQKTIERFGFERFQQTLSNYIELFFKDF